MREREVDVKKGEREREVDVKKGVRVREVYEEGYVREAYKVKRRVDEIRRDKSEGPAFFYLR